MTGLNIQQPFSDPLAMGQHYDRLLPITVIGKPYTNGWFTLDSGHSPSHPDFEDITAFEYGKEVGHSLPARLQPVARLDEFRLVQHGNPPGVGFHIQ